MSVVVGLKQDGKVWLAADTLSTYGSGDEDGVTMECQLSPKIFPWGDYVLGVVGSGRVTDIILAHFQPPDKLGEDLHISLIQRFVPTLRKCLEEHGINLEWQDQADNWTRPDDFDILLGYKGQLFIIGDDFSVSVPKLPYFAIGAGDLAALGAMFATETWTNPKKRIVTAVKAAISFCPSVGGTVEIEVLEP